MVTALTKLTKPVTKAVYWMFFYQTIIITGFVFVLFTLKGKQSALSALAGSLAYSLPTFIFACSIASCGGARAVARFMITFFGGEALKLIVSGLLFVFAVNYLHAQIVYAVIGLLVAIAAFWIASVISLTRREAAL